MRKGQQAAAIILLLITGAILFGLWKTRQAPASNTDAVKLPGNDAGSGQSIVVDQSPLKIAQGLAKLATSAEERPLAQEALRLSDYEVDLAFANALREARLHPPPPSTEASEVQVRLDQGNKLLKEDQVSVDQLTAQLAKAPESKKEGLQVNLEQSQADLDLAQDEVDDAKQDLIRVGGNLTDRIEKAKAEHENTARLNDTAIPTGAAPNEAVGLIHRVQQWSVLHSKQLLLARAIQETEASGAFLAAQHNALEAKADAKKESSPELAHHSKRTPRESLPRRNQPKTGPQRNPQCC